MWIIAVVIVGAIAAALLLRGPLVPAALESLRAGRIVELPPQRVLAVDAKGRTAREAAAQGLGPLLRAYFRTRGAPRRMSGGPRGRWQVEADGTWSARLAVPLPAEAVPPEDAAQAGIRAETWDCGLTAEILHVGGYDSEPPTIERLKQLLQKENLRILDLPFNHEEEYVRGPGMFGPGNPARYLTVIRYRVGKA
jgi:hypothetical protein